MQNVEQKHPQMVQIWSKYGPNNAHIVDFVGCSKPPRHSSRPGSGDAAELWHEAGAEVEAAEGEAAEGDQVLVQVGWGMVQQEVLGYHVEHEKTWTHNETINLYKIYSSKNITNTFKKNTWEWMM